MYIVIREKLEPFQKMITLVKEVYFITNSDLPLSSPTAKSLSGS